MVLNPVPWWVMSQMAWSWIAKSKPKVPNCEWRCHRRLPNTAIHTAVTPSRRPNGRSTPRTGSAVTKVGRPGRTRSRIQAARAPEERSSVWTIGHIVASARGGRRSGAKLGAMSLPVNPPVSPMLSKAADSLPLGGGWWFEPKWDGFRCVVFRDGDEVELGSRNERPLTRYFPEVLDPLRAALPDRAVVDGELIIPHRSGRGLDFDALLQRIHPAETRVRLLAEETPAAFVAFDLLAVGDRSLLDVPFGERRRELEAVVRSAPPSVFL